MEGARRPIPIIPRRDPRPPAFADLLRRFRVAAGWTQEELAEHAGISARAITKYESGATLRPHRETVRLLADALALPPEERALFEAARRLTALTDSMRAASWLLLNDGESFWTLEARRIRVKYGEGNRDAKNDEMRDLARIWSTPRFATERWPPRHIAVRLPSYVSAGNVSSTARELAASVSPVAARGAQTAMLILVAHEAIRQQF